MDIVIARIRDRRNVPIGPSVAARLVRSFVSSGTLLAAGALGIGLWLHFGTGTFVYFPIATALTVVAALALAIRSASRRNWIMPLATVIMSVAAVALLATPFTS